MEEMRWDLDIYKAERAGKVKFRRGTLKNADELFKGRGMIIIAFENGISFTWSVIIL